MGNEWAEDNRGGNSSMGMSKEPCKPDYDGMIKGIRDQNKFIEILYNAVHECVYHKTRLHGLNRTALKNLMGQCHVQLQNNVHTVNDLIGQQEAD